MFLIIGQFNLNIKKRKKTKKKWLTTQRKIKFKLGKKSESTKLEISFGWMKRSKEKAKKKVQKVAKKSENFDVLFI